MFAQDSTSLVAWLALILGVINLGWGVAWTLFKFWFERWEKSRVQIGIGGGKNPGTLSVSVTNHGQSARFFDSAYIVWKVQRDGSFFENVLDALGLARSFEGIPLLDSSNSKEAPTAVMDQKVFEFPSDRNADLEKILKSRRRIGVMVVCRDGAIPSTFHRFVRGGIRMHFGFAKKSYFGPLPEKKEEKPDERATIEAH
jgi:hypothetical protein